jgi:hypothetical protein
VFLSYRWTGSFDDDLTLSLFNNLSEDVFGSSSSEINVFLDKRCLQDGRNFLVDFAEALLKTSVPVVILSTASLQRMLNLKADSAIDYLLLEWTLIVELLSSNTITHCLPVIIGTYNPSAPSCSSVIADFFKDVVKAADGSVIYSGISSLPDVSVASIIHRVRLMLRQHNLPESTRLDSHTVRSVVQHLSNHEGVCASSLFEEPRFITVPASHAKEEVTRTVVEDCRRRIISMLESIEAAKVRQCQAAAAAAAAPLVAAPIAAGGSSASLDLDALAKRLRDIGLSDDSAVLADMSAKLRRRGIMALEDLRILTKDELQTEISSLNLGRVQLSKLIDAVQAMTGSAAGPRRAWSAR